MCKHEEKYCQRCNTLFECKVGNITQCQCFGIEFTDEEKQYIDTNFNECLCRNCLTAMKAEYHNNKMKNKIKLLPGIFDGTKQG